MFKFIKSLDEEELEKKIHKFKEKRHIVQVQYSTCPYQNNLFNKVWHCVMIEYKEYKNSNGGTSSN